MRQLFAFTLMAAVLGGPWKVYADDAQAAPAATAPVAESKAVEIRP